jgi:hypothetical protein
MMLMVYGREYLHVVCIHAGLETSGEKIRYFLFFLGFSGMKDSSL